MVVRSCFWVFSSPSIHGGRFLEGVERDVGMSQNLGTASSPATRDISRSLTSIYKDFLGRGPTSTNTTFVGDMVVTVLGDSLTKAEHKLVAAGRSETVRQMRRDFQDAMQAEIRAAVERHTGRTSIAMLSDHTPEPDVAIEVVILEPRTGAASNGAS